MIFVTSSAGPVRRRMILYVHSHVKRRDGTVHRVHGVACSSKMQLEAEIFERAPNSILPWHWYSPDE